MKKPAIPILLTGALLLAGTVSTAYARNGEGYRGHEERAMHMKPRVEQVHRHRYDRRYDHGYRHDRYRWEHRHHRGHLSDHPAYRPHYYRTWRPAPPPPEHYGHWGLKLFYLD